MTNETEYKDFVNSVASFVSSSMTMWQSQKEVNEVMHKQISEHLQVLEVYRDLLRDLRNQNIGYKAIITEHEKRLMEIEACLREETIYRGFTPPKQQ